MDSKYLRLDSTVRSTSWTTPSTRAWQWLCLVCSCANCGAWCCRPTLSPFLQTQGTNVSSPNIMNSNVLLTIETIYGYFTLFISISCMFLPLFRHMLTAKQNGLNSNRFLLDFLFLVCVSVIFPRCEIR